MIWILAGCLPKAAPELASKGLSPATTTLEALQQARAPRRIAVVVGVDGYGDPSFPDLEHAEDDARELAADLEAEEVGGWDEVHLVLGADARRERIVEALRSVRDGARREDVLLLSFSGHGTRTRDPDGTWHRYLLPTDARAADPGATALDLAELQAFFTSLAPARKVLIVDACFDGDGRSAVPAEPGVAHDAPLGPAPTAIGAGEAHLFATTPGRPAKEDDALGHGVYTSYLLDAMTWHLRDADANQDGALTAWEAHDWARGRTIAHTGGEQVPEATFRVVGEADVVLAGHPDARRRSDDALVYLYPAAGEAWSGAQVLVDGRSKGTLPGTVALSPGPHRFVIRDESGDTAVDGSFTLAGGRAYSIEDVARLAQGPTSSVGLRAVALSSPPLADAFGAGIVGSELVVTDRRDGPVGHGFVGEVAVGAGASPARPSLELARPAAWISGGSGWQGDRGRFRLRAGLGVTAAWAPPSFPGERVPWAQAAPGHVGWWLLAAGPDLTGGIVLGSGWTLTGTARPHLAALDTDRDGRATAVPWMLAGLGLEVDR